VKNEIQSNNFFPPSFPTVQYCFAACFESISSIQLADDTSNYASVTQSDNFHFRICLHDMSGETALIFEELLAAPLIINCSHSFCGVCLADHLGSISSIDIDVVHSCPCCGDPILFTTYERVLEGNITEEVGTLSRCSMSVRWQERRDKQLKHSQKKFNRSREKAIQIAIPIVALVLVTIFIMM
jgi:hypothetical protein